VDGLICRQAAAADLPALLCLLADDAVAPACGVYTDEFTPGVAAAFGEIERDPNNALWLGERGCEVVAILQLMLIPGRARRAVPRAKPRARSAREVQPARRAAPRAAAFPRHAKVGR
jgi:hypothetical protein